MKKYFIVQSIILLFYSQVLVAQTILIPDSIFGINSSLQINSGSTDDFVNFLSQFNGLYIACGNNNGTGLDYYNVMARFDICGDPDSTFGVNGLVTYRFDFRNTGNHYNLQQDGNILVAGVIASSNAGSAHIPYVARFNYDGTPDSSFNGTGANALRFDPISSGHFGSVYELPDSRIVCIGKSSANINGGVNAPGVMRFKPDGTLDSTFNGTGMTRYTVQSGDVSGLILQNGNAIALTNYYDGSFNSYFYAMAFDSSGAIDTTFGVSGFFTDTVIVSQNIYAAVQSDEYILMASNRSPSTDGIEIIRITKDGELDSLFGTNGHVNLPITNFTVTGLKVLANGQILIMGSYQIGFGIGGVILLNPNGSVDATFGTNGTMSVDLNGNAGTHSVNDVLELPLTRFLAGGSAADFLINRYSLASSVPHISQNGNLLQTTGGILFQWFLNGNILTGETGNTLFLTQNGSYTVRVLDDFGCDYFSDSFQVINVGINHLNSWGSVQLYPNPFSDRIHISFSDNVTQNSDIDISITDIAGREIVFNNMGASENDHVLILQNIPAGIYQLKIKNENKFFYTKIVKVQ